LVDLASFTATGATLTTPPAIVSETVAMFDKAVPSCTR
jgi:hypothetical protein